MSKSIISFLLMLILVLTNVGWGYMVYQLYMQNQYLKQNISSVTNEMQLLRHELDSLRNRDFEPVL